MKHRTSAAFLCLAAVSTLSSAGSLLASHDPRGILVENIALPSLEVDSRVESNPELTALQLPEFQLPEFQLPEFQLPEFHLPEFQLPEPELRELRLANSAMLWRELQKKPKTSKANEILDPTDAFQFMHSARLGFELNNLANGEGNSLFLRAQGNYALNPKMLLHAELPIAWSKLSHQNTDVGFGDLRLAWYYLAKRDSNEKKLIQGMMPGVEMVLPTGNATDGFSGNAALFIPYFNVKMQTGKAVTVSSVFRYVHSFSRYRAAGNPDINVPSAVKGRDTQDGRSVRQIGWQVPVTIKFEDSFLGWLTLTPDLAWNFHNRTTRSYRLDIEAGKTLKEDFSLVANLTLPLNNGNTINYILGIQAILTF